MTTLTPDQLFALGKQYLQAGEAEAARQALQMLADAFPDETEVLFWLAQAERQLQHWPQAIALLERACTLAPERIILREHLGTLYMLSNEGRHMAASMEAYREVLAVTPEAYGCAANLMSFALRSDAPQRVLEALPPLLQHAQMPEAERLRFTAGLAVSAYLQGDIALAGAYAEQAMALKDTPLEGDLPFLLIYARFIADLLEFRGNHPELYTLSETPTERGEALSGGKRSVGGLPPKELHIVGESHCLTPAHLVINNHRVVPHLQMGAKAYFYTLPQGESWQYQLAECIRKLPPTAPLVLGFGEIDCRPQGTIMRQILQEPDFNLEASLADLTAKYIRFVMQIRHANLWICGVPAPNAIVKKEVEHAAFTNMIHTFNLSLKQAVEEAGLEFIDLYRLTLGEDGWAREGVHLDHVHLTPQVMAEALRVCV